MAQAAVAPVSHRWDQTDHAALLTGFIAVRRAATAQPHSWTVPASMTKPLCVPKT